MKESEYGNVDFGTPTDDEEFTITSQDRNNEGLGDGLVEKISDWEPAARPVPDTTLDGRLTGAFGSGGVPGQWTHGRDVVSGTIGAVDSSFTVGCTT